MPLGKTVWGRAGGFRLNGARFEEQKQKTSPTAYPLISRGGCRRPPLEFPGKPLEKPLPLIWPFRNFTTRYGLISESFGREGEPKLLIWPSAAFAKQLPTGLAIRKTHPPPTLPFRSRGGGRSQLIGPLLRALLRALFHFDAVRNSTPRTADSGRGGGPCRSKATASPETRGEPLR